MLNINLTPHREYLPADTPEQRLFLMVKMRPAKEIAKARPSTNTAIVIDTSGSMHDLITNHHNHTKSKMDIVIESLQELINSGKLTAQDNIALIQFDESASTILKLTPATETEKLKQAIYSLKGYSGSTYMEKGLKLGLNLLLKQVMTSRRVILFTDGQTFDEDDCLTIINQFSQNNIPITALGVGNDFNEDLLNQLSDAAGGRSFHIVEENAKGTEVQITDLPQTISEEFSLAQAEVITNLALNIKTVQGVKLNRVMRAYPSYVEFSPEKMPCQVGNASALDQTIFILEFTIDNRPPSRLRLAQIGITYDVPGENRTGELPPENVIVQFVAGEGFAAQVDPEVMHYVQQCNLDKMVKEATRLAEINPQKAEELLENARRMTQKIGNTAMTESLSSAQEELRKTRRISSSTSKTIKMSSKGKTVKMEGDFEDELLLSEDEIRQASGT